MMYNASVTSMWKTATESLMVAITMLEMMMMMMVVIDSATAAADPWWHCWNMIGQHISQLSVLLVKPPLSDRAAAAPRSTFDLCRCPIVWMRWIISHISEVTCISLAVGLHHHAGSWGASVCLLLRHTSTSQCEIIGLLLSLVIAAHFSSISLSGRQTPCYCLNFF